MFEVRYSIPFTRKLPSAICTILYHVGANLRPRPKLLIQRVTRVEISAHVQLFDLNEGKCNKKPTIWERFVNKGAQNVFF